MYAVTGDDLAQLTRRYYDLVDSGDHETMLTLFADDVIYERGGTEPIRGIEAMRRFYAGERIIAQGRHELDQILVQGDWVVVRGRFNGRLKDGQEVAVRFADFHQVRDGRIQRRYTYFMDRFV